MRTKPRGKTVNKKLDTAAPTSTSAAPKGWRAASSADVAVHTATALGTEIQQRRQEMALTQEELARRSDTSRTAIALLEQGRRTPSYLALARVLQVVGLDKSPFARLADPGEELRLRFEQSVSDLIGRTARLEHLDNDSIKVARSLIDGLFQTDRSSQQAYDALSSALVFYDASRPSVPFFSHYFGAEGVSSIARFERSVERFQRDAIRLFATFREAYITLSRTQDMGLALLPITRRGDEHYRQREQWDTIERIPPQRLPDLGYISAARVRQEHEERQQLSTFLMDLGAAITRDGPAALAKHSETKRRKMGSLLRKLDGSIRHDFLSPLFVPDPGELKREAERVAPKGEGQIEQMAQTQAMGQRNLARYLSADHLDVYVATSMRSDADFASVNSFVESLFSHEDVRPLKMRYFNPTQSWIEDRVAKGLVEALMLRRADFAIYMAQKEDTFGKDSEASVALGQGKPVIVYVPRLFAINGRIDSAHLGSLEREELLRLLAAEVPSSEVDDTADSVAILGQLIQAKLSKLDSASLGRIALEHWADFDLIGEARRIEKEDLRSKYHAWMDAAIASGHGDSLPESLTQQVAGILTALAVGFEKRAKVFREVHPLALQVIVSTGVLNGILVARSVDQCASLIAGLVKNDIALELVADENNYKLVESSTRSITRVISRNQLVVNAFSAFYNAR